MGSRSVALVIAFVAFAGFLILGNAVGQAPDPGGLMFAETQWVNHGTLIAWWLTWMGFAYVLAPACVALVVIAVVAPRWRWTIVITIVALLLAWQGADFFQHYFARPRRLDWVVKHETAFSYPSSHAAIVAGFYFLWAALLARSRLAYRTAGVVVLAALGVGILWSRLALGAHYLTDVVGGVLWGVTVVALLAAIVPTNIFQGHAGPSLE